MLYQLQVSDPHQISGLSLVGLWGSLVSVLAIAVDMSHPGIGLLARIEDFARCQALDSI